MIVDLFTRKAIPMYLTLANLVCGLTAIIMIFSQRIDLATLLILLAFVFDLFDGLVARTFGWMSRLGVELDSLADAVSFGVAPAIMIYHIFFDQTLLGIMVASIVACCAILRLAYFNITDSPGYFVGMSTPYFTAIILALLYSGIDIASMCSCITAPFFIALSFMMICSIQYPALKGREFMVYKIGGVIAAVFIAAIFFIVRTFQMSYWIFVAAVYAALFIFIVFLLRSGHIIRKKYLLLYASIILIAGVSVLLLGKLYGSVAVMVIVAIIIAPLLELSIQSGRGSNQRKVNRGGQKHVRKRS